MTEVLHGVDVVHPVFVHHPEHNHPLQLPHDRRRDLLLLGVVNLQGLGGETPGQVLRRHLRRFRLCQLDAVFGEEGTLQSGHDRFVALGIQTLLLSVCAVGGVGDDGRNHAGDHIPDIPAIQNLLALAVDNLPLLVHHVVVLQGALAGLEVPGLHAGLRTLNGPGEHFVFNGQVFVQVQLIHNAGDAVAAEQADQIVLQAQVKPGLAGVALPSGAAPQLVVDAAGVVPLGTDDEESSGGADLFRLALDLLLVLLVALRVPLPGAENLLVGGFSVAGSLGNHLVGETRFAQVVFG